MSGSMWRTLWVSGLAVAAMLVASAPADAQNLFDRIFGGPISRNADFPPAPPHPDSATGSIQRGAGHAAQSTSQRSRTAIAKVKAPSFFDYKVDSLPPMDFAALRAQVPAAEPEAIRLEPDARPAFGNALPGLDGYALRTEREISAALIEHYAQHPDFLWVTDGVPNARARSALRVLGEAASHGLSAGDYAVGVPLQFAGDTPIRFEMTLSARLLRYAADARRGRIDPNRISGYHDFERKPVDYVRILADAGASADPRPVLEALHPQGPEYLALRTELESLRNTTTEEDRIVVDPKLLVRPGSSSAELPKILRLIERKSDQAFRDEHAVMLAQLKDSETYSDAIVPIIKAAQESHGLKPDGVIGPRTVEALAGHSNADRLEKVLIALEQRRWLPDRLPPRRVFINQPAFSATYFENDVDTLSMRVVVGTTSNQTTFFQDDIEYVEYNPYWGVPQSIIVNEMLPRLRRDPGYLDRAGYEVSDSRGNRIPSSAIDWGRYGGKVPYSIRQTPSEANALGELKIMFPNKHAIYMHDTPARNLFDRDTRAFSHGCIRLHDPRGMAAAVLGTTREHIAKRIGRGHNSERLTEKVPVYVAYFTAWPDDAGKIGYFADIYGRDDRMRTAIDKTVAVRAGEG